MKQHYEILFIIPAEKAVSGLDPIKDKVKAYITEHKGEITKEDTMGKLKLAYPIENVYHGFYEIFEFDLETDQLQELDQQLKFEQDVLRHMIVIKKVKTAEDIENEKKLQEKIIKAKEEKLKEDIEAKEEAKKEEKPAKEEKKISLDDLDKKLDELLEDEPIV